MVEETGVRLGLAHAALLLTVALVVALHPPVGASLVLLVALALAAASWLPLAAALLTGLSCWAVFTGFAEHRYGVLTLSPDDLLRLAAIVAVAGAASVVTRSIGRARR